MKHNRKNGKHLISCVFSFLLTLIFVILLICAGAGFGIFSDKSIIHSLKQSDYYNKVYIDLLDRSGAIIEYSGLSRTILEDVITLEKVYIAGKNYTNAAFTGREAIISTSSLKLMLLDKISRLQRKVEISGSNKPDVDVTVLVAAIEQDFLSAIELPFLYQMREYKSRFFGLIVYLIPILLVLTIMISYLLLKMHHRIHRGIRYITYAMISASLIILVGAFLMSNTDRHVKVLVGPEYYRHFINIYFDWCMKVFIYIGGIGMIISLVLISFVGFLKSKVENN